MLRRFAYKILSFPLEEMVQDTSGSFTTLFAVSLPILIGCIGLAVDVGRWELAHENMQRAADAAAISAAVAYQQDRATDLVAQVNAITSNYGYVNAVSGANITVNRPPASGSNTNKSYAVEVIVSQPQPSYFASLLWPGVAKPSGRSVSVGGPRVCILALDPTANSAFSAQGSVNVSAANCSIYSNSNSSNSVSVTGSAAVSALMVSTVGNIVGQSNITASVGVFPNQQSVADPYASVSPSGVGSCDQTNLTVQDTRTLSPGVYCGGLTLNAQANVTLSPGTYYMNHGSLSLYGGSQLSGTGVSIVFTSSDGSNYANANINGGAAVNLSPPSTGPLAGIVFYGDRSMPVGTKFSLGGGTTQSLGGAVYLPKAALSFAGGPSSSSGCNQIIADTINLIGNSNLSLNCSSPSTKLIGAAATLLE